MEQLNEGGPTGAPQGPSDDEYRQAWGGMQDQRAKRKLQEDATAEKEEKNKGKGGALGNFFKRAVEVGSNMDRAVLRGFGKGADELSNTLYEGASALLKPNANNINERYKKWYNEKLPTTEEFRQAGQTVIEDKFGEEPEGVAAFVQSASQFAFGMVGASKFLKGAGILRKSPILASSVAGALADMSVFDPHQERLSNLAQNGPQWMRNPLTAYLAADEDDSAMEGRLKAGLEGFMTGYSIDRFIAFAKPLKRLRALKKGDDPTDALKALEEAAKIQPKGVVAAMTPNGKFRLQATEITGEKAEAAWKNIRESGFMSGNTEAKVLGKRESKAAMKGIEDTGYAYEQPVGTPSVKPAAPVSDAVELSAEESAATLKTVGQTGYAGGTTSAAKQASAKEVNAIIKNMEETGYAGGATKETPDPVSLTKRESKATLKNIGETGYANDMGDATVTLEQGKPYVDTVTAIKTAKATVGDEEFLRRVQLEQEKRGIIPSDDPLSQLDEKKAAIEQVARDIYHESETAAAAAKVDDGLEFDTAAEAEATASAINDTVESQARPRGIITPEQREQVRGIMQRISEGTDPDDVDNLAEGINFNFNYWQTTDEVKGVINALAEAFTEAPHMLRNTARSGAGRTWAETAKIADGLFVGMNGDEVAQSISSMFNVTENLDAHVKATRVYVMDLGKQIARLSRTAESNPVSMDQLDAALEQLLTLGAEVAGTSSNIGRALNAHKMPIGEMVAEFAAKNGKKPVTPAARKAYKKEANALLEELSAKSGDEVAMADVRKRINGLLTRAKNELPTCGL